MNKFILILILLIVVIFLFNKKENYYNRYYYNPYYYNPYYYNPYYYNPYYYPYYETIWNNPTRIKKNEAPYLLLTSDRDLYYI
jgi:hypothetical protein